MVLHASDVATPLLATVVAHVGLAIAVRVSAALLLSAHIHACEQAARPAQVPAHLIGPLLFGLLGYA